jgi:osmotically-inducible protein OsmY
MGIGFVLSAAAAGLILTGASALAAGDEGSTGANQQEEQQIQANLEKAPDLKNNRIDVKVDDGVVVLEGIVDSTGEKTEAQRLAHVDGVLGVNNRIVVRPGGQ